MAVSGVLASAVTQTSSLETSSASHTDPGLPAGDGSLSSSPRHCSADLLQQPILERDESDSESPNEPATPVSGRQSQDFHTLSSHEIHQASSTNSSFPSDASTSTYTPSFAANGATPQKTPLVIETAPTPPKTPLSRRPTSSQQDTELSPLRQTQSKSSLRHKMGSLFRRSQSQSDKAAFGITDASSDPNLADGQRKAPSRRWSVNRSSTTTRSNTPPSPGTPPLEMNSPHAKGGAAKPTVPNQDDFLKKKPRASTGLAISGLKFGLSSHPRHDDDKKNPMNTWRTGTLRRTSSFDYSKRKLETVHTQHEPWALPAEEGIGMKARRMSLSLPDDFTVDTIELNREFEYQHKLGRHRKHLGKGATSTVTLMHRKGYPDELYAVKEFRGKQSKEDPEDYKKKVKSEYSLAKALHHPNIVETIRLCTDHGRWNHVMEYCQEGDLYTLVEKGYLKTPEREKDRQCLFKQLIQGLNYLHNNGIAHRDIKLENLLITNNSKLKITDFGASEVFCGIHPGLREAGGQCGTNMDGEIRLCAPRICGSMPYIAPEVVAEKERYDPRKLDVWGAAVVLIHLVFGAPLWHKADQSQPMFAKLVKGWEKWNAKHQPDEEPTSDDYPAFAPFDEYLNPPVLRRIVLSMLDVNPSRRPTIDKIVNMKWMKNVECCQLESYDDPSNIIDASKMSSTKLNGSKVFCHDHLPIKSHGHSLGKMPGQVGY